MSRPRRRRRRSRSSADTARASHEDVSVRLPAASDLVHRLRTDARRLEGWADDLIRDDGALVDEGIDGVAAVAATVSTIADRTADAAGVLDAFITELVALDGRPGPAVAGCYAGRLATGEPVMPRWWLPTVATSGADGLSAWRSTVPYRIEARPVPVHAVVQRVTLQSPTGERPQLRPHPRHAGYARAGLPTRTVHRVDPAPPPGRWGRLVVPDPAATALRRTVGPVAAGFDAVAAGRSQLERDRHRHDLGQPAQVARAATVGGAAVGGGIVGSGLGAKGGAAAGASLGALAGPVGILAGAAVGGFVGAAVGGWGGARLGEAAGRTAVERRRDH